MCGQSAAAFLSFPVKKDGVRKRKAASEVEAAFFPIALHPFFNG
jgi:hypothetical protein